MGNHENISAAKWPKQGPLLGKPVEVCFRYDAAQSFKGRCVRDDAEAPHVTIFSLENGRVVLATECQYSPLDGELL